jgi:hypothetical protein
MSRLQGLAAGGAAIRPSWIKSGWYRTVAKRAREIESERVDFSAEALGAAAAGAGTAAATAAGAGASEVEGEEGDQKAHHQDRVLDHEG